MCVIVLPVSCWVLWRRTVSRDLVHHNMQLTIWHNCVHDVIMIVFFFSSSLGYRLRDIKVRCRAKPYGSVYSLPISTTQNGVDPLCTSPIVYHFLCVPVPLCTSPFVYLSPCVPVPLCTSLIVYLSLCVPVPLCTSPVVHQSLCVPVPLCTFPLVYQSPCVPVPLCTSPFVYQSLCVPFL